MLSRNIQSFDVETTGLNPYLGAKVFSYCIGHGDTGVVEVVRLDTSEGDRVLGMMRLRRFFADTSIVKVAHNYKFELGFLRMMDCPIPNTTVWHDTMLMSQILRNDENSHSLDYLTWKYGKFECPEDDIVIKQAKARGTAKAPRFDLVDHDIMVRYQTADGERPLLLYSVFHDALRADPTLYADYLNEIELVKVTQRMEQRGMLYNEREGEKLQMFLAEEDYKAMQIILQSAGRMDFNVDSPKQLGALLFDTLKMPVMGLTNGGSPSTDKDTLMALHEETDHPVLHAILRHRAYSDGLDFLKNYQRYMDSKGRIHPTINTNKAATGRETCVNPNLQNVGKDGVNEKKPYPVPLRKAFRADPNSILLFVDYAGIEMRLIIAMANETELLNVLQRDPDADMHYPTMECFLGVQGAATMKRDDPTRFKSLRGLYKNTGFGVAYGAGDEKVAVTLGRPFEEVKDGLSAYRIRFPKISNFSRLLIKQIKHDGFITTAFGRHLYIPKNKAYIGSNYTIQGAAAGILKRAQVRTYKWLHDAGLIDLMFPMLPIHDEIVFSMHRSLLPRIKSILRALDKEMIDMPEISVPLRTEWKMSTTNWADAKEFKI